MKIKNAIFGWCILLISSTLLGQQGGGGTSGGGGAAAGAAPGGAGTVNRANPPGTTLPPGLEKQNPLPPGLSGRNELPPGLIPPTNAGVIDTNRPFLKTTNAFGAVSNQPPGIGTNQFGINTNQFGVATNQFGLVPFGSNGVLRPTGGATNRVFGTNIPGIMTNSAFGTNSAGFIAQDRAISQADRTLLLQIRQVFQQRAQQLGLVAGASIVSNRPTPGSAAVAASSASTNSAVVAAGGVPNVAAGAAASEFFGSRASVHFIVSDGVVTIVGAVPTLAERQQIEALVQGVPGVTQVVDNLQVRGRDVAFTPADQALLAQIQQAIRPVITSLGVTAPTLIAREGVVTIVGSVPSVDQSQQIESIVAQTPGVIRVSNRMAVDSRTLARELQASTNAAGTMPLLPNRFNGPPTNQIGTTTNVLLPTARFNAPNEILGTNQQTSP